ncbi:MAG: hypothetical protein WCK49_07945 [Myxococcaceae bacterium]
MRFLWILLVAMPLFAKKGEKPQALPLPEGPVKAALKKNYKIHLARNFTAEIEKELEKKISKK